MKLMKQEQWTTLIKRIWFQSQCNDKTSNLEFGFRLAGTTVMCIDRLKQIALCSFLFVKEHDLIHCEIRSLQINDNEVLWHTVLPSHFLSQLFHAGDLWGIVVYVCIELYAYSFHIGINSDNQTVSANHDGHNRNDSIHTFYVEIFAFQLKIFKIWYLSKWYYFTFLVVSKIS